MFRSSTIIREHALNLAKVIFMLKHSVKLRRYLLCGCVAACHGMACVLYCCAECDSSLMMVEDRNMYVYFNVNFNMLFKLIKVHLLVSEL